MISCSFSRSSRYSCES